MGKAVTVKGRLAVPRHVEMEEPGTESARACRGRPALRGRTRERLTCEAG